MFKILFESLIDKGHTVKLLAATGSKVSNCKLLTYETFKQT